MRERGTRAPPAGRGTPARQWPLPAPATPAASLAGAYSAGATKRDAQGPLFTGSTQPLPSLTEALPEGAGAVKALEGVKISKHQCGKHTSET